MIRITSHSRALCVPVRASDRRGGGAAVINPVAAITPDRRGDGRDPRGRRSQDRMPKFHLPSDPVSFAAGNGFLAGMHAIGHQERTNARPDAYEAVGRYEDRYFAAIKPGLLETKSA